MERVAVRINNSIHVDNGSWNKDRMVYGFLPYYPKLGKCLRILDEDNDIIFSTTPIIAMRLGNIHNDQISTILNGKSIIIQTVNSEYEIFKDNFDKSKIVNN